MLSKYLEELRKIKLLTREEELALWKKVAKGDAPAHNLLMRSYQPLVFKTALTFKLPSDQVMELIQEGTVGLLEAAERFDYTKGVAFSIFALHRIKGRMIDYLNAEYGSSTLSLDSEAIAGSGILWSDTLVSAEASPSEQAERDFISGRVLEAMERLPNKEQQVLAALYLEDKRPIDIAAMINVTTSHVYRLQKKGVRRVRGMLSRLMADLKKS
ncbi:MAG: sigma-70 family RNA polymerase sigma factor [Acidaminococcaceae bacterium]|nr:sigma-70 family RNA polymerase sigma factor [Acidaminococcaceae bacterium]